MQLCAPFLLPFFLGANKQIEPSRISDDWLSVPHAELARALDTAELVNFDMFTSHSARSASVSALSVYAYEYPSSASTDGHHSCTLTRTAPNIHFPLHVTR